MKITLKPLAPEILAPMKEAYLATLTAPQDAYWQEGLIGAASHLEIYIDNSSVGYLALDAENQLMQFHIEPSHQPIAPQVFKGLLAERQIQRAMAATIEPFYFGLCLDHQTEAQVHTYLFGDLHPREPQLNDIQDTHFRLATEDDIPKVLPLFTGGDEFIDLETIETNFAGPLGYAQMVIGGGILHVLEKDGEVLGTGEFRQRMDWVPYADLGMIVNKKFRRRGIGTYILGLLKKKALGMGLKPICSCEAGNQGSRKAVENAGFITHHRVVSFSF